MLGDLLPVGERTVRLFLHVLAATVWVGGQLTLAGLVPALRRFGPDATRAAARRFAIVAWSAFAVLVATGIWNVLEVDPRWSSDYGTTLKVKLGVVGLSGLTAAIHSVVRSKPLLAVFGALSALTALGALFLGTMLTS